MIQAAPRNVIFLTLAIPVIIAPIAFMDAQTAHALVVIKARNNNVTGNTTANTTAVSHAIKPLYDGQKIKTFYMTLGSKAQWQLIENYYSQGYKINTIVPFRQNYLVILEKP
jgi:hypothetical protein